jgi:hypothetical protein
MFTLRVSVGVACIGHLTEDKRIENKSVNYHLNSRTQMKCLYTCAYPKSDASNEIVGHKVVSPIDSFRLY